MASRSLCSPSRHGQSTVPPQVNLGGSRSPIVRRGEARIQKYHAVDTEAESITFVKADCAVRSPPTFTTPFAHVRIRRQRRRYRDPRDFQRRDSARAPGQARGPALRQSDDPGWAQVRLEVTRIHIHNLTNVDADLPCLYRRRQRTHPGPISVPPLPDSTCWSLPTLCASIFTVKAGSRWQRWRLRLRPTRNRSPSCKAVDPTTTLPHELTRAHD